MEYMEIAVYALVFFGGMGLFLYSLFKHFISVTIGKPENRFSHIGKRIINLFVYVLGQKRVRMEPAGYIHFIIFWGFLIHLFSTGEAFLLGFLPARVHETINFSFIPGYHYILGVEDVVGGLVIVIVIIALYRRIFIRPERLGRDRASLTDGITILGFILVHMVLLFLTTGIEMAYYTREVATHIPPRFDPGYLYLQPVVKNLFMPIFQSITDYSQLHFFSRIFWWVHMIVLLGFLTYITPFSKRVKKLGVSKHIHILFVILNVFFSKLTSKGEIQKMDIEDEEVESFGISSLEEFTWKENLDLIACTKCGRCQEYCPAYNTGKALNPKDIIGDLRHHLIDVGGAILKKQKYKKRKAATEESADREEPRFSDEEKKLMGKNLPYDIIGTEALWNCTTCGACVEVCPAMIEHIDKIVGMRRYLTSMESSFPKEMQPIFEGWQKNSNPWNIGYDVREDWVKNLKKPVKILNDGDEVDILFYVGCMNSFDPRALKVTKAFVGILQQAGVDFGILGKREKCCGETAKRMGNELVAQMMIQENIENFKSVKFNRIVTICPHCFNTLKNEYQQFGGEYEVITHLQIIDELLEEGRIELKKSINKVFTYHDSCYLGRHNNIYELPRRIIKRIDGVKLKEMEHHHKKSFCCGGGGGMMWIDEESDEEKGIYRINEVRTQEALDKNVEGVATACPYCMTMFEDGLKAKDKEEDMKISDIAELVYIAMDIEEEPDFL
ncbi:4Fe-4S dicluster domain-containing protein [bacterium]|nr:4Fe-4S dicluster domain-containing protein [bacterium]